MISLSHANIDTSKLLDNHNRACADEFWASTKANIQANTWMIWWFNLYKMPNRKIWSIWQACVHQSAADFVHTINRWPKPTWWSISRHTSPLRASFSSNASDREIPTIILQCSKKRSSNLLSMYTAGTIKVMERDTTRAPDTHTFLYFSTCKRGGKKLSASNQKNRDRGTTLEYLGCCLWLPRCMFSSIFFASPTQRPTGSQFRFQILSDICSFVFSV